MIMVFARLRAASAARVAVAGDTLMVIEQFDNEPLEAALEPFDDVKVRCV